MGILKKYKIYFVGFYEIKVKENNVSECLRKIVNGWCWENNYFVVVKGKIWLIWKVLEFDVNII